MILSYTGICFVLHLFKMRGILYISMVLFIVKQLATVVKIDSLIP